MAGARRFTKPSFKDYFLILQVHPEADGAMVDAAYWHLARRYGDDAVADPSAKQKLDDLNEAYGVLGSPERRKKYMRLRASVLGEGALPTVPELPRPLQPLAIMNRQSSRPREQSTAREEPRRGLVFPFRVPVWQNALAALAILVLAGAGLASQVYLPLALGLLIVGLSLTMILLVRRLPRLGSSFPPLSLASPKLPSHRKAPASESPATRIDSDRLRKDTEAMVARLRGSAGVSPPHEERAKAAEPRDPTSEPVSAPFSDSGNP